MTMRVAKIMPYVVYIIAFSIVCSLASALNSALSAWSWGYSMHSFFSMRGFVFHFPVYIFFAVLQVIAAIATVRQLSLKKLFYLFCLFSIIGALLIGFHRQMMSTLGGLFYPLFLTGQFLPYVAPVFILALTGRKKTTLEPAPDVVNKINLTSVESEVTSPNGTVGSVKTFYKRYWYVLDILLILVVFLYGTLNDPFGLVMYVCGLYNQLTIRALMTFIWVFWLVPAMLCFGVLLLRIILSWPKHIMNKSKLLFLRLLVIIGLGIYCILPFTFIVPHGFSVYIKGFEKYIRAEADIAGIQDWLGTLEPEDCVIYNITNAYDGTKRSSPKDLQMQEWPKAIVMLGPRFVRLSVDVENHPRVRLSWGSGFLGTWGLVVGHETMSTPESDLSRYGEYRKEIGKGVYIWYGVIRNRIIVCKESRITG
jgi:hypothetical protein